MCQVVFGSKVVFQVVFGVLGGFWDIRWFLEYQVVFGSKDVFQVVYGISGGFWVIIWFLA